MTCVFFYQRHCGVLLRAVLLTILTSEDVSFATGSLRKGCGDVCPAETYESRPCTDTKDRECSACTVCRGSYYEASPCTSKTDRVCYHTAYPLLLTGQLSVSRFIEEFQEMRPKQKKHKRLKVEASDNVFLEDLQNTRNLETTYYVTDMTQASDFYWDRESQLRVNIGILNIHLIPEYHDVVHDGDNQYMLNSPNEVEDRLRFQQILQNSCRNPIPEYYSITLEVSRDRTTRAYETTCDSYDPSKPRCLPPLKDGDTYLYRTLNEPCHRMPKHTFPKELKPAANSIVCTENNDLLSEIFNQTFTEERFIRFPSTKCKNAHQQCTKCKNLHSCSKASLDSYERKRCLIDCFNLMDCKTALSQECQATPVECAMGDAYQYTIQPVFHSIRSRFRCHVRHQNVPILYELFYFLQIPSIGFQTPKVHKTLYARGLNYQRHGKYKADFLTVEHATGFELQKDFILTGQEANSKLNYTVSPATIADRSTQIDVHAVSMTNHAFVVSAQFENPFDYSSSTWVNNNDCRKNISKLKPVYDGQPVDAQEVSVMVQNPAEPFQYFLKSVNSPPYIRFTVPGNTSILPYYFRENGPVLNVDESLSVILELSSAGRIWVIHVSGRMSGCPAYLGIVINDRLEMEQLFRYDILIVCPAEFNVTFKVPNWGQQSHKTYDITFQDPRKTHSVFVTYFSGDHHPAVDSRSDDSAQFVPHQNMSSVVFFATGAIAAYFLIVSFLIHICLHRKHSKFCKESSDHVLSGSSNQPLSAKRLHRLASRQMCLTTTYVITRVVYSVFMSVTMLYLGLLFMTKHDLVVLSKVSHLHVEQTSLVLNVSSKIEQEIQMEIAQYQRSVDQRQMSCSSYIGDLMNSISRLIRTIVYEKHLTLMHSRDTSISYLVINKTREQFLQYARSTERFLLEYRTALNSVLNPVYADYRKYLLTVYENEWFSFAHDLFNLTQLSTLLPLHQYDNLTAGAEMDFPIFLEIEEVDEFRLWLTQFWERYHNQHPSILPKFPEINLTKEELNCGIGGAPYTIAHGPLHHYDSTHFFGQSEFVDPTPFKDTKAKNQKQPEIHGNNLPHEMETVFHDLNPFEVLSSGLFWIVCIVLDVLLLSHRICHTYCCAKALYVRLRHFASHDRLVCKKKSAQPENGGCCYSDQLFCQKENRQQNQKFLQPAETNHQTPDNRYQKSVTVEKDCTSEGIQPVPNHRRCNTVQFVLSNAVQSRLVPHLVVASSLMMSLCFLPKACLTLLDRRLRLGAGVLGSSAIPVVVQTNLSSLYVTEQSGHIATQMRTYETQMNSELAILKAIVLLFNIEQKLKVERYVQEFCVFESPLWPTNGTNCDIRVPFHDLDIPILPCNFVLVEPRLQLELTASKYERQLAAALEQFTLSISSIIVTVLHYLFVLMAVKLILHIVDNILFHCLRLHCGVRKHHWTQPDYRLNEDAASLQYSSNTNSSALGNERYNWHARKQNCARATTATLVNASPTRVTAMLFDFGYSETKV